MTDRWLEHARRGERLPPADAAALFTRLPLLELGRLADTARRRAHPDGAVTYVVDRNINYTNVCTSKCRFCAFCRDESDSDAYVLDRAAIHAKAAETLALGGSGILLQGGLHPSLPLSHFEDLLQDLRRSFPTLHRHCFSPPEVLHLARGAGLDVETCLRRLMEAGLQSLPGGGAEVLDDRVRQRVSPAKCSADDWLRVMHTAHRLGLPTTATMMFGCGESLRQRIRHLQRIRALQDRTGGFRSFIPWTFQPQATELGRQGQTGTDAVDYLRMLALSRLYLDNVPTIQASWVTQGLKIAQVSLAFGANDIGSVMIEENVVAATGVRFQTTEAELRSVIRGAGFTPVLRNAAHTRLPDRPEPD